MGTVRSVLAIGLALLTFVTCAAEPRTDPPKPWRMFYDNDGEAITFCLPEKELDGVTPVLDTMWQELLVKEQAKAPKKGRPKVCFMDGPLVFQFKDGMPGLLYGYDNFKKNEVLVAVGGENDSCVVIHEFLHAIFGKGHDGFREKMKIAGCGE